MVSLKAFMPNALSVIQGYEALLNVDAKNYNQIKNVKCKNDITMHYRA